MAVVVKGWLNVSPDITYLAECTPSLCSLDYATLKYIPSEMGNIAFMSLYGILLFAIVFMSFFHYRTLSFTVLMSLGFVCEVVGYWGRVQLHYYVFDPGYFVINIVSLSIAPVFFSAALYVTLSRVIMHYGPHNSPLTPRIFTISFVTADVFALMLQSIGAGLAQIQSNSKAGEGILLAGLNFQIISLIIFICLATKFFWNVAKERREMRETCREGKGEEPAPDGAGYRLMIAAFAVSAILFLTRSLFRLAELAHGFHSPLANNEVAFVVLEGCVVLVATVLMSVFHPGLIVGEAWVESGWKKEEVEKKEFDLESVHSGGEIVYMRPWYGNSVSS